jgi:hypothetical protein
LAEIVAQRVSKDEIYIRAGDGKDVTITRTQIQGFYAAQTGNAAARKSATVAEFKQRIATALGVAQIAIGNIVLDFNPSDTNATLTSEVVS